MEGNETPGFPGVFHFWNRQVAIPAGVPAHDSPAIFEFAPGNRTGLGGACARNASNIDIMMQKHHDASMRTTLDIPDDLHRIATSLARHNGRSLGQVVAELMRRGLETTAAGASGGRVGEPAAAYAISPVTGLPVVLGASRPITDEDVKALEDEG